MHTKIMKFRTHLAWALGFGVTYLHSVQDFFRLNTVNCMLQASQGIFFETFDLV